MFQRFSIRLMACSVLMLLAQLGLAQTPDARAPLPKAPDAGAVKADAKPEPVPPPAGAPAAAPCDHPVSVCLEKKCVPHKEIQIVKHTEYGSRCEDFCVPKCSLLGLLSGHKCGCDNCQDDHLCCKVYHRKVLIKYESEEEKCVTKCHVEEVTIQACQGPQKVCLPACHTCAPKNGCCLPGCAGCATEVAPPPAGSGSK